MTDAEYERRATQFQPYSASIARKRGLSEHDINDVVQEVQLKLWKAHTKITINDDAHAQNLWRLVTVREIARFYRARGDAARLAQAINAASLGAPLPRPPRADASDVLEELDADIKDALWAVYEGHTLKEHAEETGQSYDALRQRVNRARKRVRATTIKETR